MNKDWGTKRLLVQDLEQQELSIQTSYFYNYRSIKENEFYKQLPPLLQNKLLEHFLMQELIFFDHLFNYNIEEACSNIPLKVLTNILCSMECQFYLPDSNIILPEKEFKCLYLIKEGGVKCYTRDYQYMYDLSEKSFFGEFNILFGLFNAIRYVPHLNRAKLN